MSKPAGIAMGVTDHAITMRVRIPSQVEDKIWDAVREAVDTGWDAKAFVREVWSAWEDKLGEDSKAALEPFEQMFRRR